LVGRRTAGLVLLLVVAALVALGWWVLRNGLPDSRSDSRAEEDLPAGALADYLPPDAAGVMSLNTRALRQAPAVQPLMGVLRHLVAYGAEVEPWLAWTGIDALTDLDEVRVIATAGDPSRPLWLVRGRLDPGRFVTGPDRLQPRTEGRHRVYEYASPRKGTTWLVVAGDALVCGPAARVRDALDRAGREPAPPVRDRLLRRLLAQVDRGRPAWVAASLEAMGRVGRLPNWGLELVLRPVFNHARGVTGSIAAGDDLKAEFSFTTRDADSARQLEGALQGIPTLAEGADLFLGTQRDLLPLFRLVEGAEVTRQGATVSLRGRLDRSQLQP
jgi:hypothetical protein